MSSCEQKLKILTIHGYGQSDKIFNTKMGSIKKFFKKEIDFIFIKAPHKILEIEESNCEGNKININTENTNKYGWWFTSETKTFKAVDLSNLCIGFDESLELIKRTIKEQGSIDGLLGFSQGGSFVSILCAMQQKKIMSINFSFAIIISGFKSLCKTHEIFYNEQLLLPTLHVYGSKDKIISAKMAKDLSNVFINKEVKVHEGGHHIPSKKYFYDFIKKMIEKKLIKI